MKFQLQPRTIISSAFLLLSVASAAFLVTASLNYVQLFPAISQLNTGVSRIVFENSAQAVLVHVYVNNPVDYTGLNILTSSVSVYFFSSANASDTLFKDSPITDESNTNRPITSQATTAWDWTLVLRGNQTTAIAAFYTTHNSNVVARYSLSLNVVSFLSAASGPVPFQSADNVTLLV